MTDIGLVTDSRKRLIIMTGEGLVMAVLVLVQTNVGLVDDSKDLLDKFEIYSL
jgi:hypothetical protein